MTTATKAKSTPILNGGVDERSSKAKPRTKAQVHSDYKKALTVLPENWIMCRDVRHAWDVLNDFHVTPVEGTKTLHFGRDLLCDRCGSQRKELYVMRKGTGLEKVAQDYVYPEGYQMTGLERPESRTLILQMEQYRRAMARSAAAEPGQTDSPEK